MNKSLRRTSQRSEKVSELIRYVVFAGFGLIWMILQTDNQDIRSLSIKGPLGIATVMLCCAVITDFLDLMIDVSSNFIKVMQI